MRLLCTPATRSRESGGTGRAIEMADRKGVKVPRNLVDFTPQKPAASAKPAPKMSDKQIRSLMKAMKR